MRHSSWGGALVFDESAALGSDGATTSGEIATMSYTTNARLMGSQEAELARGKPRIATLKRETPR